MIINPHGTEGEFFFAHGLESLTDPEEAYTVRCAGSVTGEIGVLVSLFTHAIAQGGSGGHIVKALTALLADQRRRLDGRDPAIEIQGGWAHDGSRAVFFAVQCGCAVAEALVPIPASADMPDSAALLNVLNAGKM